MSMGINCFECPHWDARDVSTFKRARFEVLCWFHSGPVGLVVDIVGTQEETKLMEPPDRCPLREIPKVDWPR